MSIVFRASARPVVRYRDGASAVVVVLVMLLAGKRVMVKMGVERCAVVRFEAGG